MTLTGFNLPHYLLDKGFLSYDTFFNQSFTIEMASSRNIGFVVNKGQEGAMFVKQVRAFDAEKTETLRTEATCYWLANNEPEYVNLKKFLPQFIHYDYLNHILIVDFLSDTLDLQQFYYQQQAFPLEIGQQLAELLVSYHKDIFKTIEEGQSKQLFRKAVPGPFLMFGHQLPYMKPRNQAEEQMQQLIRQQDNFSETIAGIQAEWQPRSLIHGDIKPNNFLINRDSTNGQPYDLRLIDWEIADLGDPAWDVAAIFQSYLLMWVMSAPDENRPSPVGAPEQSAFELDDMQPTMQHFWETYAQRMGYSEEEATAELLKATRFCAVKLLHTCYESSVHAQQLYSQSAKMLQLSFNILQSPEETIESLFGIKTLTHA